jgi:hypothetical protein
LAKASPTSARKALLDNVAPADRRGALMSALFLVLYIAAAVAAIAVAVRSGPLGLQTATIIAATCLTSRMSVSGWSRSS